VALGKFMLMPKLGMTMESGRIIKWLCQVGDKVEKGEPVVEVQTDKVNLEVESLQSGVMIKFYAQEGDTIPVNQPIAYVGEAGEEAPDLAVAKDLELAPTVSGVEQAVGQDKTAPLGGGDLIVIGGGPGGYVAAIRAAQLGVKVTLVEKDKIGGTCLNWGCIPTKVFYKNAEAWRTVLDAEKMGISLKEPSLDWAKVQERKVAVVNQLVGGVEALLAKHRVQVIKGEARVLDGNSVQVFRADGGSETLKAGNIILATGTLPLEIPMEKSSDVEIMDVNLALELTKLPKSLAVIGGGFMGVEFADIFSTFGVEVSIIELLPTLLPAADEEIAVAMQAELEAKGIQVFTGSQVVKVTAAGEYNKLFLSDGREIAAEKVLLAVGRKPNKEAYLDLDLKLDAKGYISVDEKMQTNRENIYAIGDITGKVQLAHVASAQALVAAENIAGRVSSMHYDVIPSCVFTHPQVAFIGLSEKVAVEKKIPHKVYKFPFYANGKALALGCTKGFVKIIADSRWDEILGVHILGPGAADLIAEVAVAMKLEATSAELARIIHAHPTLSEAIMEAAAGIHGEAIHF
jgi:dihydrolipoamide dehydrogenase